jgi:RND family efflux transporter MFP subunit
MSLVKQTLLCFVLLAVAAGGWYAWRNPQAVGLARETPAGAGEDVGSRSAGARGIPGLIGQEGAVNVITAEVVPDAGGESVTALGTAKAARSVTIYPEVTGVVAEVSFTPGEAVDAGEVLLRLESDEQQVALDRARVTLEQALETLERARTLAQSKTISEVALSDAERAAQIAEIEVRTAEIMLARRSIAAPFAGVTGLTDISVGDLVSTSTAITMLDDLSTIRVGFEVPERRSGRIRQDQPITATAQALPGEKFTGRIAAIDNRIDETTRTLRLEAELDNPDQALKAGMAIAVTLDFETDQQLAVPTLSIQWDRRGSYVWKIVEGAARRAEVTILQRESGIVMVAGDLVPGDRVVVEGVQRLREGAKVSEVNQEPTIVDGPAEAEPGGGPAPALSGARNPVRARS